MWVFVPPLLRTKVRVTVELWVEPFGHRLSDLATMHRLPIQVGERQECFTTPRSSQTLGRRDSHFEQLSIRHFPD
jgi:hypothetical protein